MQVCLCCCLFVCLCLVMMLLFDGVCRHANGTLHLNINGQLEYFFQNLHNLTTFMHCLNTYYRSICSLGSYTFNTRRTDRFNIFLPSKSPYYGCSIHITCYRLNFVTVLGQGANCAYSYYPFASRLPPNPSYKFLGRLMVPIL